MSSGMERSVKRQHLGPSCASDRLVRVGAGWRPRQLTDRDEASIGYLAAVPAQRQFVAKPACDQGEGERLDAAAQADRQSGRRCAKANQGHVSQYAA